MRIPELREFQFGLENLLGRALLIAIENSANDAISFYEAVRTAENVFKPFATDDELEKLKRIDETYNVLNEVKGAESYEVAKVACKLGDALGIGSLLIEKDREMEGMIKEVARMKLGILMRIYWRLFYADGVKKPQRLKYVDDDIKKLVEEVEYE